MSLGLAPRSIREELLPAEWVGIFATAHAASFATGQFGAEICYADGSQPSLEWEFESSGGVRDIWAQYAAMQSRPMRLLLNGELLADCALWEKTSGWEEMDQHSLYQISARLPAGANRLRVECDGASPHIRSIAVCEPGAPRPNVVARLAQAKRLETENMQWVGGLSSRDIATFDHAIETLRRKGVTAEAVASLFGRYVRALAAVQDQPRSLDGFGGPFNGERLRLRTINDVCEAVRFSAFLETGAYLGTTTEFLARSGAPVYSCEAMLENFLVASTRLSRYRNVDLRLMDSRSFLKMMAVSEPAACACPFIYLDAHWFDDLPLMDELNFIFANFKNYFVVIDDFEVPDSKYFFDRYSSGKELTCAYVLPKLDLSTNPTFLVPANASTEETGPRKGTLYVAPRELYVARLGHIARLSVLDVTPYRT